MNIRNIFQYVIRPIYLFLAMGLASYSFAEQNSFTHTHYSTSFSREVASIDFHSPVVSDYQTEETSQKFSFRKKNKTNEEHVGSFLYKTIDNPDKVRNQIAGTAILYGLDSIGLGDTVKEGIYFIKKNTRYSFGDCGDLEFRTSKIRAASCLSDGGSVELNSSYDFGSVQLQFRWSL